MSDGIFTLSLDTLAIGIPALTNALASVYKEACIVCLSRYSHRTGVLMQVQNRDVAQQSILNWNGEMTDDLSRSYVDQNKTTDFAACGIALLLVRETTEFTAIEQSNTGTTIDYYLGPKTDDDTLIFNRTARLEVSGSSGYCEKRCATALAERGAVAPDRDVPSPEGCAPRGCCCPESAVDRLPANPR